MAKITYLCEGEIDNTARIHVDGKCIDSKNFIGLVDSNIHAIQWDGKSGEIEYKDGTPNKIISDISSYDFEKKFADEEKAMADAEAKAEADAKRKAAAKKKSAAAKKKAETSKEQE